MARTVHITEDELAIALKLREDATTATEYRKALSVILTAKLGLDPAQTAELLGVSRGTTFRDRRSIRNQDDSQKKSWGGRRRYTMSLEEEREFLASWEITARDGGILSVPPLHAALVERLGHETPPSTTYRLLARHGWRKVQPDTKHPKSDPAAQEEFKKNSPRFWLPPPSTTVITCRCA